MTRSSLAPRLWYVAAAITIAMITAALAFRRDGLQLWVFAAIAVSTAIVSSMASLALITRDGVARLRWWLLAGALVPILSVIGFLEIFFLIGWILTGYGGTRPLYWETVTVGSFITIPMGIVASIVLLWAIRKLFYGSDPR